MISRRVLREKALQNLYAYFNSEDKNLGKSEKELLFSIQKVYDLYHLLLLLIIDIRNEAENKIEIAKNKNIPTHEDLNPNTRFIDNKFIAQISENESLSRFINAKGISWVKHPELIKKFLKEIYQFDDFKKYMQEEKASYADDKRIVTKIYENIILLSEDLDIVLEEESIYWNDDLEFVVSMVIKTIKKFGEGDGTDKTLLPMYKNDEDRNYIKTLFRKAILSYDDNKKLIDAHTKNWELDRIAFMDILLLNLAVTEITEFTSIPLKVSFNEYIEISKYFSTKKSSVFINGVLDKIIHKLNAENKIMKTGRGLME